MTYRTKQYRPSKRQRFLRPVFGLAAAFALHWTFYAAVLTQARIFARGLETHQRQQGLNFRGIGNTVIDQ